MRWWLRPITSRPSLFSCSSFLCCSSLRLLGVCSRFRAGSCVFVCFVVAPNLLVLLLSLSSHCGSFAIVLVCQLRALHSVLLPCLGVCHDWCCIVSFQHFLMCLAPFSVQLLRFCSHVWLVRALCRNLHRCLCDRYGCYRGRRIRAVLCGSEDSSQGVRRQVCVCVYSVRPLLVMVIAMHHVS